MAGDGRRTFGSAEMIARRKEKERKAREATLEWWRVRKLVEERERRGRQEAIEVALQKLHSDSDSEQGSGG